MQTNISQDILNTPEGKEANDILRSCVHCGFCTATCPTYQELGGELDGPRGRIYLIKDMLEGGEVTQTTQQHLDQCLTCRACETTCPSGVEYAQLAKIGKSMVDKQVKRPLKQRLMRWSLLKILPYRQRFSLLLKVAQTFRMLLPKSVRMRVPLKQIIQNWPTRQHPRKVLLIEGCVQPALSPEIDVATAVVLDALGVQVVRTQQAQCCGAVENHLNATDAGLNRVKANIDAWLPYVDDGVEVILGTASACVLEMKEYGHLLRHDKAYAQKAALLSDKVKDISEVLADFDLTPLKKDRLAPIAFHASCTLQHGQQLGGVVEGILKEVGYTLLPVQDGHLCCGSAGTYSVLQPELAKVFRDDKVEKLSKHRPSVIATANIGCLHHMQEASDIPIKHWIMLLLPSRG
jgi:glycolate oxidase iron-sulfur subunit